MADHDILEGGKVSDHFEGDNDDDYYQHLIITYWHTRAV